MKIAILGYGVVGHGIEKLAALNGIEVAHILVLKGTFLKDNLCDDLDIILNDDALDCVIECIGGDEPAFSYVEDCLKHKHNVISSNKKMIVNHLKQLIKLANENNVTFLCSSACGGALPWLPELNRIKESDVINRFSGIMNGTSNFVLNKIFNENLDFNVALKKAQELGYAEADPSDDIDGVDTKNKTILSYAIAYNKYIDPKDIFVKGIRYFNLADLNYLKENNYKCILLGKGNSTTAYVMPTFVKNTSIFFNVKDNYNCFSLDAEYFGPFSLIGQGAGSLPTASNVIRDLKMLDKPYKFKIDADLSLDYSNILSRFYIRANHKIDAIYVDKDLGNNTYLTKNISIETLKNITIETDFIGEIDD